MGKIIFVDGIEYTYEEISFGWDVTQETVELRDSSGLVATASIDHNMEDIGVTYYGVYDGKGYEESSSYPYFEYSEAEDLATWMAATHPAI